LWTFLDMAQRPADGGGTEPFRPTKTRVNDVLDALAAVSNLPGNLDPPVWLENADTQPPASEMLPVANGLLHLPTGKMLSPTPSFFGMNAAPLVFDPRAPDPVQWFRFLGRVDGFPPVEA
jgi:putative DNA primase/helicase